MRIPTRFSISDFLAAVSSLMLTVSTGVRAAPLTPGDIVVVSQSNGSIFKVNPATGGVATLSIGGLLANPMHTLIDRQGRVLTAERTNSGTPGIVRYDPANGTMQSIASGSQLAYPVALDLDQSQQNLFVLASDNKKLVRVELASGVQTPLATLTGVLTPQDVDLASNGDLYVTDFGSFNSPTGKIVRVNPVTGQLTTVASGGNLFNPGDLLIHPSGDLLVTNRHSDGTSQLLRINPLTGNQQIVATLPSEGFIALQDERTVIYADFYQNLSILRVDLITAQTSVVSSFHFPDELTGVAIYSVPEPTAPAAVGLIAFLCRRRVRRSTLSQR